MRFVARTKKINGDENIHKILRKKCPICKKGSFFDPNEPYFFKVVNVFKDLEGQLARWLERLQQYEFEVVHRKGLSRKNVDGLSRRQCEITGCDYCAKVEKRNSNEAEKSVVRIVLVGQTLFDWRREQMEDPSVSFIFQAKEAEKCPSHVEIAAKDVSAHSYWDMRC